MPYSGWLEWNRRAIPKLAQAFYDERRFADLRPLADSLEQAGCADAEILGHCRSDRGHHRGCWVVDRIIGKA